MLKFKLFIAKILPYRVLKSAKKRYRSIRGNILLRKYKGNDVFCPCCEKSFSKFLPFNYEKDLNNNDRFKNTYENTTCPYCYSMPRHRIVCYFLKQNLDHIKGKSILMIGAEYAIEVWLKINRLDYKTADLYDKTADIKLDIQNMPFAEDAWSLIICNHVLEHVPDFVISMQELKRVLKPGGWLEISAPTDRSLPTTIEDISDLKPEERIRRFGQFDHLRIFGDDFDKLIENEGFNVIKVAGEKLPAKIGAKIGPANYDDNTIYFCTK